MSTEQLVEGQVTTGDDAPTRGSEGIQAVTTALQILEYLAVQRSDIGVTAISVATGMSKSRVHRHLRTLLEQNYVEQPAGSDKYRAGRRLVTLGRAVAEHFDLASLARPLMLELRDRLGHPVVVSQPDPHGARVLATVLGTAPIEISVREGSVLSFHCSSQGKVALAWGDQAVRDRVFGSRLDMHTPSTIVSPSALQAEVARVKACGWAVSPNEAMAGVNALAAPLFDGSANCVGAIAIIDSVQYVEATPSDEQIREVLRAAARISRALGYVEPAAAKTASEDNYV